MKMLLVLTGAKGSSGMRIVPVPSQRMHRGRCWSASRRPGFLPVPEQRRQVYEVWFMVILFMILRD